MGGKFSRDKGSRGERQTANELQEGCPLTITRGVGQTQDGSDTADVEGVECIHFEVKSQKRGNPRAALKQADEAAAPGRIPVAVIRDTRKRAFVSMYWDDFLDLWREYWEIKNL